MKVISYSELRTIVKKGDVIGISALASSNLPSEIFKYLVKLHDESPFLGDLTFICANDIGAIEYFDEKYDFDSFVTRKLVKRLIMSILTRSPRTQQAMMNNEIEAYYFSQGVISTHYRLSTLHSPGTITRIGLHTYIDPRNRGGKVNQVTEEDLVSLVDINGTDYLRYDLPHLDIALLRGTYADTKGNIYMHHESHLGESYGLALDAHSNGGKVIVQVKDIVEFGKFNPKDVYIPGKLVDFVVVNEEPQYHKQVPQAFYDPALSGEYRITGSREPFLKFNTRKIILRRTAQFLTNGDTVSIGFGINNELSNLLIEEKADHLVQLNLDVGAFGGIIGSHQNFGMTYNLEARMRHEMTWDFIYNGGIDIACLSFAEIDQFGNVNVSAFRNSNTGTGGFIDISQTVKKIIFSGSMTVSSKDKCDNNKLIIEEEGKAQKFVKQVQSIDFNASYSRTLNQEVYYVTERAVFQLTDEGLELIEIAPGLNVEKDILNQMQFKPNISKDLKVINPDIYQETWGKLNRIIK